MFSSFMHTFFFLLRLLLHEVISLTILKETLATFDHALLDTVESQVVMVATSTIVTTFAGNDFYMHRIHHTFHTRHDTVLCRVSSLPNGQKLGQMGLRNRWKHCYAKLHVLFICNHR
ncbi:hypothetical protein L1987_87514 [Smallanthus sonchifolius]|nr:hypothetical protein L1987_87514 [Smallanthus sonchifolius]